MLDSSQVPKDKNGIGHNRNTFPKKNNTTLQKLKAIGLDLFVHIVARRVI